MPRGGGRRPARGRAGGGWAGPGATADGHAVSILANVQDGAAARAAARDPVEGVGLFRTELCFLNRETEPTVEEQAQIYGEVLDAVRRPQGRRPHPRRGLGQAARSSRHPEEANPALGVRGLRIAEANPGLLERQLDAIAAAAAEHRHRALGDGADDRHRRRGDASPSRSAHTG